jgi:peptidase E
VTDSWAESLKPLDGLGWLAGTCCPHYDGEPERRPSLHALVESRLVPTALALDDGAAAHFIGRKLARVVACRPGARAYRVAHTRSGVTETALPVRQLRGKTR